MPYAPLRSRGFCFTAVCAYIGRPPFFPLLIISSLYESDIGIAFNASSILIACTGTYSPLSRTPPPVNENNSLDVFKSKCRFLYESNWSKPAATFSERKFSASLCRSINSSSYLQFFLIRALLIIRISFTTPSI